MTMKRRLEKLWRNFSDKSYRDTLVSEHAFSGVAVQVHENRSKRGWSQGELAKKLGVTQARISRLEDPDKAKPTLSTLVRLAAAFNCALVVRFVPFSEFARWHVGIGAEPASVPEFSEDSLGFIEVDTEYVQIHDDVTRVSNVVNVNRGDNLPTSPLSRSALLQQNLYPFEARTIGIEQPMEASFG